MHVRVCVCGCVFISSHDKVPEDKHTGLFHVSIIYIFQLFFFFSNHDGFVLKYPHSISKFFVNKDKHGKNGWLIIALQMATAYGQAFAHLWDCCPHRTFFMTPVYQQHHPYPILELCSVHPWVCSELTGLGWN